LGKGGRVLTSKIPLAVVLLVAISGWSQTPQRQWKDRAEYDLYDSIQKAQNPQQRLDLLNTWKSKYPQSEVKQLRDRLLMQTYHALNQGANMYQACRDLLSSEPKDIEALVWANLLTVSLNNISADALAFGESSARTLLGTLASEGAALKERTAYEATARTTLGWVAWKRKQYDAAEREFTLSLQLVPGNGLVSYWFGTVLIAQRKPEKQPQALYHFARAVSYTGPGEADPATRKQIDASLTKGYTEIHGDDSGLDEIKALAKANVFPPPQFTIKTSDEIAEEKAAAFRRTNPSLALWSSIRKELAQPAGEAYFREHLKDAKLPAGAMGLTKLRGYLVAAEPATDPRTLILSMSHGGAGEITLKLDGRLRGTAPSGSVIAFEGVATAYTRAPLNLVFMVERVNVEGWPTSKVAGKK
jgi:hypothetical protein